MSGRETRFPAHGPDFWSICHCPARPDAGRHETANQQPINNNRHQVDSVSIRPLSGLVTLCPPCKTAGSLGFLGNSHHPQVGGSMAGYVIHMPSFCQPFVSPLSALCQSFRTQHKQVFWRLFCRHSGLCWLRRVAPGRMTDQTMKSGMPANFRDSRDGVNHVQADSSRTHQANPRPCPAPFFRRMARKSCPSSPLAEKKCSGCRR